MLWVLEYSCISLIIFSTKAKNNSTLSSLLEHSDPSFEQREKNSEISCEMSILDIFLYRFLIFEKLIDHLNPHLNCYNFSFFLFRKNVK